MKFDPSWFAEIGLIFGICEAEGIFYCWLLENVWKSISETVEKLLDSIFFSREVESLISLRTGLDRFGSFSLK